NPSGSGDQVPTMTSATTPSGVASASSEQVGSEAWRAFDGNGSTFWISDVVGMPVTLTYQFPSAIAIASYAITVTTYPVYSPKNWTFEGSNNGSSWTVLDTRTNSAVNGTSSFTISSPQSFGYYKLNISVNNGGARGNMVGLNTLQMQGANSTNISLSVGDWVVSNGTTWDIMQRTFPNVTLSSTQYPVFASSQGSASILGTNNTFTFNPSTNTLSLSGNVASTTTTSGTIIVTGGVGVSGAIFIGGNTNTVGLINTAGEKVKRNAQSGAYTILVTDYYVIYTGTGGQAFTMPSATTAGAGATFIIKHNGTGVLTITRAGSDTIDSAVSITPGIKQSVMLISDGGTNWEVN
ncbi:MAG: discoidin domain-containing protein, partial [bacterium]